MEELIKILTEKNKTISTMESCTGGFIANEITNAPGASNVFKFGAVTYSNEYKIKLGVDKDIIDRYTVYSIETAKEMSKKISDYTNSNLGIGITGKLNRADENNNFGNNNEVFICVYDRSADKYHISSLFVKEQSRKDNKLLIANEVINILKSILVK